MVEYTLVFTLNVDADSEALERDAFDRVISDICDHQGWDVEIHEGRLIGETCIEAI